MDDINLTSAEWRVMECLWQRAPLSGREVTEAMAAAEGWSRSTTLTLLSRLEHKGAVSSGEGGKKEFSPVLRREEAALRETEQLLERAYGGSLSLMVSAFARRQRLKREELDELYAMLKQLEEEKDD